MKVLLAIGLQYETAGRGSLALYTSVCPRRLPYLRCLSSDHCDLRQFIFALLFEFTISHTTPSVLSIMGALMILSSSIFITVKSSISAHLSNAHFSTVDEEGCHKSSN